MGNGSSVGAELPRGICAGLDVGRCADPQVHDEQDARETVPARALDGAWAPWLLDRRAGAGQVGQAAGVGDVPDADVLHLSGGEGAAPA